MSQSAKNVESLFAGMHEELRQWRVAHPDATLDEIAAQVTPRRRELMGALLVELAVQEGNGYAIEGLRCEQCGEPLVYKGTPERDVLLLEGEGELVRAYYHCPHCEAGLFPPRPSAGSGKPQLDAPDDQARSTTGGGHSFLPAGGAKL